MRLLRPEELNENVFNAIGREWMLITAGRPEHFNTMTASWGGLGFLWNKPVAFVFIRPERYTYHFIESEDSVTLTFLGQAHRDIYNLCGKLSGRNTDKMIRHNIMFQKTICHTAGKNRSARTSFHCNS